MKKFRLPGITFLLSLLYIVFIASSGGRATLVNEDRTGAPGSAGTCGSCHTGGSFGTVTLSIQIFNQGTTTPVASYVGGTTYDMNVTVTKSAGGTAKYGFQMTCLTTPGNSPITTIYTNLGTNVQQKLVTTGLYNGRRFVEQTQAATNNTFTFSWTAPPSGTGTVRFYASGNAVNGTGSSSGDNSGSASLTLNEFVPLTVSGNVTDVSCFGGNNGSINITAAGGISPYTYHWGSGITSEDRTNLTAGTYTVTVTDNANATATASFTVTQPSVALSINGVTTNVSCFGGNNGAINITASGGTLPYTYNWGNNITSEDIANLTAGGYTVTVTDSKNCTATVLFNITQPAQLTAVADTITIPCSGASGIINVSATGGITPYTGTGAFMVNLPGTYLYNVTDANGCTATATGLANASSGFLVSSFTTSATCSGVCNGSIMVMPANGTPPFAYTWNNANFSGAVVNNVCAGSYEVTVSDSTGCSIVEQISVSEPTPLHVEVGVSTILCYGGTAQLDSITATGGTAPYMFLWGEGSSIPSTVTEGTYSVIVIDGNACTAAETFTVTQPDSVSIHVVSVTSDDGTGSGAIDIDVSGGVLPYSFLWNTQATTEDISGLSPGVYTVQVTDANGCQKILQNISIANTNMYSIVLNEFRMYPNPVTDLLKIRTEYNAKISLYNTNGFLLKRYSFTSGDHAMDLSDIASGLYVLLVVSNNKQTQLKILKTE